MLGLDIVLQQHIRISLNLQKDKGDTKRGQTMSSFLTIVIGSFNKRASFQDGKQKVALLEQWVELTTAKKETR